MKLPSPLLSSALCARSALSALPALAAPIVLGALALAAAPARADSLASSASSATSASIGSLSDSSRGSSRSSGGDRERPAEGEYRVRDVRPQPERPGMVGLQLQRVGGDAAAGESTQAVAIVVPQAALAQRPLRSGDRVQVRERVYGLELAHADDREPFFLALDDGWRDDLPARVVTR